MSRHAVYLLIDGKLAASSHLFWGTNTASGSDRQSEESNYLIAMQRLTR